VIPEEQADFIRIIKENLTRYSYHVSDECVEAIAAQLWDEWQGVILNGYA
jgi:hypothetical protein